MKVAVTFYLLLLFCLQSFGGNSELFRYDDQALKFEFAELDSLENLVLTTNVTAEELGIEKSFVIKPDGTANKFVRIAGWSVVGIGAAIVGYGVYTMIKYDDFFTGYFVYGCIGGGIAALGFITVIVELLLNKPEPEVQ